MSKTCIIIGTSAAGIGAAYRVRMLDANARIICISDEKETPYNKCFIVEYLAGERELSQVLTLTPESAHHKNIECMLGVRVTAIDAYTKTVKLNTNEILSYDRLFIGTGCSPVIPSIDGITDLEGIFTFYNMRDVNLMHVYIKRTNARSAIIIGAGLTGLEAADGLHAQGLKVHVVERAAHVLPHQVDARGAALIHDHMQARGISLYTHTSVKRVLSDDGMITGVELDNGLMVEGDLLVCAVGVKPNGKLAQEAGITMHNGYIQVNDHMQTNVPDIYAGGDGVLVKDCVMGAMIPSSTWPDAMQQGMVAAYGMVGQRKTYLGVVMTLSSSFFGIKFAVCGNVKNLLPSYRVQIQEGDGWYHLFVYDQHVLKGFMLVGNTNDYSQLRRTLTTSHQ